MQDKLKKQKKEELEVWGEKKELENLKNLDFNKHEYEYFMRECGFTDRQKEIFALRRRGWSITKISIHIYLSESTIKRELKKIKNKIIRAV